MEHNNDDGIKESWVGRTEGHLHLGMDFTFVWYIWQSINIGDSQNNDKCAN